MNDVIIKYQIINDSYRLKDIEDIAEKIIKLPGDLYFDDMVNKLIEDSGFVVMCPVVENLYKKTWNKILSEDITDYMDYTCKCDFILPHYSIIDMQTFFNFFDEKLVIINSSGGFGGMVGEKEGIKFIINSNERDRHPYEPHIHCKYGDEEFRIRLDNLTVMNDDKVFKNRHKSRLAKKWVMERKDKLLNYYNNFAVKGKTIPFVASL